MNKIKTLERSRSLEPFVRLTGDKLRISTEAMAEMDYPVHLSIKFDKNNIYLETAVVGMPDARKVIGEAPRQVLSATGLTEYLKEGRYYLTKVSRSVDGIVKMSKFTRRD